MESGHGVLRGEEGVCDIKWTISKQDVRVGKE